MEKSENNLSLGKMLDKANKKTRFKNIQNENYLIMKKWNLQTNCKLKLKE